MVKKEKVGIYSLYPSQTEKKVENNVQKLEKTTITGKTTITLKLQKGKLTLSTCQWFCSSVTTIFLPTLV